MEIVDTIPNEYKSQADESVAGVALFSKHAQNKESAPRLVVGDFWAIQVCVHSRVRGGPGTWQQELRLVALVRLGSETDEGLNAGGRLG